jgi:urease beta subunit
VLHHFAIWQGQAHLAVARQQKSGMHMKIPSTTALSFPTISPLLAAVKN